MYISNSHIYLSLSDLKEFGLRSNYDNWVALRTKGVIIEGEGHNKAVRYDTIPPQSLKKLPSEAELRQKIAVQMVLGGIKANQEDVAYYRACLLAIMKGDAALEAKAVELAKAKGVVEKTLEAMERGFYKSLGYANIWDILGALLPHVQSLNIEGLKGIKTVKSLYKKVNIYLKEGAESLVNARYGNDTGRKVGAEVQALIGEVYAGTPYGGTRIQYEVNNKLAQTGHELMLSESCIRIYINNSNFRAKYLADKQGKQAWRNEFDPIIWRKPPSKAGLLWFIDGTPIELYYRVKNKRGVWTLKRLYIVVVLDAYSWKVVGYSIGERETHELVKMAVQNAIINENYTPPHQFGYDNAIDGELEKWLCDISGHSFAAAVGNARTKVIEPFFMQLFESKCKDYVNFSGLGIRSKKACSHINPDNLDKNMGLIPEREGLVLQISEVIAAWNDDTRSAGPAANRVVKKVRLSPAAAQQRSYDLNPREVLTYERQVEICWQWREYKDGKEWKRQPYIYDNGGVGMTIEGEMHRYTVAEDAETYLQVIQESLYVKYLPLDISKIYLYRGDRPLCEAYAVNRQPMALADREESDAKRWQNTMKFKKDVEKLAKEQREAAKELASMFEIVTEHDAESRAKAGFALKQPRHKEELNEAEDLMKDLYHVEEDDLIGETL